MRARPRLVDYLQIATHDSSTLELRLRLGAIACGRVAIRAGQVVHAEMPGATGELALALLGQVPGLEIDVGALGETAITLDKPWSRVLGASASDTEDDELARARLTQVYAELRKFGLGAESIEVPHASAHSYSALQLRQAQRVAATLLRRAGLLAYLAGDLDRARRCFERVLALSPRDDESRANAERIRARMLDDEGRANEREREEVEACG